MFDSTVKIHMTPSFRLLYSDKLLTEFSVECSASNFWVALFLCIGTTVNYLLRHMFINYLYHPRKNSEL